MAHFLDSVASNSETTSNSTAASNGNIQSLLKYYLHIQFLLIAANISPLSRIFYHFQIQLSPTQRQPKTMHLAFDIARFRSLTLHSYVYYISDY